MTDTKQKKEADELTLMRQVWNRLEGRPARKRKMVLDYLAMQHQEQCEMEQFLGEAKEPPEKQRELPGV
jgi:hypothetical protein